jgi:hypothetical protein
MISIGTSGGENSFIGIEHLTEKEVGEFRTSAKSPLLSGPMVAPNDLNAELGPANRIGAGLAPLWDSGFPVPSGAFIVGACRSIT